MGRHPCHNTGAPSRGGWPAGTTVCSRRVVGSLAPTVVTAASVVVVVVFALVMLFLFLNYLEKYY